MCICDCLDSSLHHLDSFGCQCRRKQLRRFGGDAGEWLGCIGMLKWWCPRCLACNRCNPQQLYCVLCIFLDSRRYIYIMPLCRTLIDSFPDMQKTWFTNEWVSFGQETQAWIRLRTQKFQHDAPDCGLKYSGNTALRTQKVACTRGSTKMVCLVWSLVWPTDCHYGHPAFGTKRWIIPPSLIVWKCTSDFKCAFGNMLILRGQHWSGVLWPRWALPILIDEGQSNKSTGLWNSCSIIWRDD